MTELHSGMNSNEYQRYCDEAGYLPCRKSDWGGNCPDSCADDNNLFCNLCEKDIVDKWQIPVCPETMTGSEINRVAVKDMGEYICIPCAIRIGKEVF
jgi:hypothetical protein